MARFFVAPDQIIGNFITLSADDSDHIRSLRIQPYEEFIVCDGNGTEYVCCLYERKYEAYSDDRASVAHIMRQQKTNAEPSVMCISFIAYAKGERLDYAIQKSVELGVNRIFLFNSKRCIAHPKNIPAKLDRLQKIALETSKISGRGIVPGVFDAGEFGSALELAVTHSELTMLCYEDERSLHLMTVLERFFPLTARLKDPMSRVKTVAVITGPEGGFEPDEVALARSKDISVVSLGPRILRSETAPAAALAVIMYHTGNL